MTGFNPEAHSLRKWISAIQHKIQFQNVDSRFTEDPEIAPFHKSGFQLLDFAGSDAARCGHSRHLRLRRRAQVRIGPAAADGNKSAGNCPVK